MYFPTPEQVAVAWLKTVTGVPAAKVATALPGDTTAWADTGFLTVRSLGGAGDVDLPRALAAVQVDAWACTVNSQKPPWGLAGHLAGLVWQGCYDQPQPGRFVVLDDFYPARVSAVFPLSQPRRIPGDEAGFARYELDLQLVYTVEVA